MTDSVMTRFFKLIQEASDDQHRVMRTILSALIREKDKSADGTLGSTEPDSQPSPDRK